MEQGELFNILEKTKEAIDWYEVQEVLGKLERYIAAINRIKGWDKNWSRAEKLLLMHSEISEAVEEMRVQENIQVIYHPCITNVETGEVSTGEKPLGLPIELADLVIRLLHFTSMEGIDLVEALRQKLEYNERRPYRHGNKRL